MNFRPVLAALLLSLPLLACGSAEEPASVACSAVPCGSPEKKSCPKQVERCVGGKLKLSSCDPCQSPSSIDCDMPDGHVDCGGGVCVGFGQSCGDLDAGAGGGGTTGKGIGGGGIGGGGIGGGGIGGGGIGGGETGGSSGVLLPPGECQACAAAICGDMDGCACAASLCAAQCTNTGCPVLSAGAGGAAGAAAGGGAGGVPGDSSQFDCSGVNDNIPNKNDCYDDECKLGCGKLCPDPLPGLTGDGAPKIGSLDGHQGQLLPNCAASSEVGSSVVYRFVAGGNGVLALALKSADDLILSAYQGQCEGGGYAYCRNDVGSGGTEGLKLAVKKEDVWFVAVTAPSGAENGAEFSLTALLDEPVCGDSKKADGEDCDDGNLTDGDGCSSDCEIDACDGAKTLFDATLVGAALPEAEVFSGSLEGGSKVLQASCSKLGADTTERVVSIRAANEGRLEVKLTPADADSDLVLSVWSSCQAGGELRCADAAPSGGAERLSLAAEAGQLFYLIAESYSGQGGKFSLEARTLPVSCGDGLVVKSVEQCDPASSEKNCDTSCTRPLTTDNSLGPGVVAPFPLVDGGGAVFGRISPAGDADQFLLTVPPGKGLTLAIGDPTQAGDCAELRTDSQLEVFDEGGQLVGFNDDAGATYCSSLTLEKAGSYVVRVRSSARSAPAQVFSYKLTAAPVL